MKLGILKSVGHNIADSLGSGIGLMVGVYVMDIFAEAAACEPGFIEVDFLNGVTNGTPLSASLKQAIGLYASALPKFCLRHGIGPESFIVLRARYGTDSVVGPHFRVTIEDPLGRSSSDLYVGTPGRRVQGLR